MASHWKGRVGRTAVVVIAAAAALAGGCASPPPPTLTDDVLPMSSNYREDIMRHSPPEAGDSFEDVAQRGYRFEKVYEFLHGGHRYAFGKAISSNTSFDLVFIDSKLACTAQQGLDGELLQWEWAGEPDGLLYLAGRLKQVCGLEPPSPPRTLPALVADEAGLSSSEAAQPVSPHSGSLESPPLKKYSYMSSDQPVAMLGRILVGVPLGLVAAPFVIVGAAGALVVGAPWIVADESAKRRHLEQRKQMQLGLTRDEVVTLLGKPEVEFPLAGVDTNVLMYAAGKGTECYVGFENDRVIWIHARYPWLNHLAKQAKEAQKHGVQ